MTLLHAILLGIIQGLTEFIPVSSTAHLFIASSLLGLPSDERTFSFNVIIQLGTVVAMLAFFWQDIWQITKSFFLGLKHRQPFENFHARLGWLVIAATIPAGIAGLLLREFVQTMSSDSLLWAGIRLLFTALLLTAVEYFDKKNRSLESATWLDALTVGLFQVLAIFPGASRSGSTIAGGMVRGFDRPSAARFAFLMSAPILLAAGLYETVNVFEMEDTAGFLPYLAIGFITAAGVGWLSIKWLLAYLKQHSLYIFAVYCFISGTIVLFLR
jgi:undecaprenyl-diphosphatase